MSSKRKAVGHPRSADRAHTMKSKTFRPDSERDSGFSDASSEQMSSMETTDSEDSAHPAGRRGHQGGRSLSSGLAVVGGSYPSLSRMIIMNNVLLKQPVENPPAMKPWGLNPTVKVVQQPPFVFIQPVVSRQASKEAPPRHKRSKKYLPILKSYPKIAPYPRDSSGRGDASSSISSSSRSERSSGSLNPNQWEASQKESTSDSAPQSLPVTAASPQNQSRQSPQPPETSTSPPAVTQTEVMAASKKHPLSHLGPSTSSSDQCSLSDCESDSKRKRFCNTYNILSKSGLLDITLRTKELLRQNRRTQSELDRLKEQMDLFLRVLQSGDGDLRLQLQTSLQEEEPGNAARLSLKAD